MSFSQIFGFKPIRQALQIDSMDEALRNGLWNCYYEKISNRRHVNYVSNQNYIRFSKQAWIDFFKQRTDEFQIDQYDAFIKNWFQKRAFWNELYEFIEFCVRKNQLIEIDFTIKCNNTLEREMSAYRFADGLLTRITSEVEIEAIDQATQSSLDRWKPVTEHVRAALTLFSDRQNPDYRNSVKESISAVEAACKLIAATDKATLSSALSTVEKKGLVHKDLKEGFKNLYGYTSDADGIRHALTENDRPVTFDEAKFMLVTCSAFTNYLQAHLPQL
ncbi:AbiJ-NTD4 domain-containing protein [Fibrella aquatilis]|uniref:HEPN AbiJ-N-terminal domain-containing protein n=1 Tax=Fibrella aquatilis TaxID=2817059 RepID=A0A939K046_9BACT|nr:hypothetical protein [Fibrella aquatilis]MBO0932093.1 hypothetical protein [Fibrella aquatilis]